jgi:hypothetical protein
VEFDSRGKPIGLSQRLHRFTVEVSRQFYAGDSPLLGHDLTEDEIDLLFQDEVNRRIEPEDREWLRTGEPPPRPPFVPDPRSEQAQR